MVRWGLPSVDPTPLTERSKLKQYLFRRTEVLVIIFSLSRKRTGCKTAKLESFTTPRKVDNIEKAIPHGSLASLSRKQLGHTSGQTIQKKESQRGDIWINQVCFLVVDIKYASGVRTYGASAFRSPIDNRTMIDPVWYEYNICVTTY